MRFPLTTRAVTLGTFRLVHAKQPGDVVALRRLSERHSHELYTIAQWSLLLSGARS